MKIKYKFLALTACLMLAGCSSNNNKSAVNSAEDLSALPATAVYSNARTLNNFDDYVQFLKRKAAGQGVSSATLTTQNNIRYIDSAVRLDQKQAGNAARRQGLPPLPPNPNGVTNYLTKHLTQAKVDKAEDNYYDVQVPLQKASSAFGVQKEFILALWGMESSFGYYQGDYDVLSVLATLAFDGRRETLFSKEFINAMKMLDAGHLNRSKMLGSWAGAMGQTQFMPSSYLNYAADGDKDGTKDIWSNEYDVFASIANYLHTVGWDDTLPWGIEVSLTTPLPLSLAGTEKEKARSLNDWQAQGVLPKNMFDADKLKALSNADLWLVRPDKEVGRAFLVSNNYRTILDWNRSNYYALSVGMFADRIKQTLGF
ncbi:lytic murein transglycosylase [Basfia succiniciproducens]|uniref:lytic murein transglycosylase n=1 Tax=Basfia succiniciproducens TaxID=653940 RepID=UPI0008BAE167|nr:lytic murein transglycosylase [Basfia succiniciproducens]SEP93813.1 membrane-bound lytic murein transglycosylase B [Basfia succiniciproducens]